ncbi:MAG: penicillin-binding protein 1A [Pseudomonadota bacterium]
MKAPSKIRKTFQTLSLVTLGAFVFSALLGLVVLFYITAGLPPVSQLKNFQHSHASEVFSDDGKKIGEFTTERRYPVSFKDIPLHVIQAFLSAEDSNFFHHKGIDVNSIARAVWSNLVRGRYAQGGSTITQQVARALLLESKKKVITRKLREMVLAYRMEKELNKEEILALYLSEIYLGHGSFGIGAAARNYFHKDVRELTVAQASLLAGLPQRPNDWNPFHHPDLAKKRQSYVIRRMVDEGYLDPAKAKDVLAEAIRVFPLEDLNNTVAPYFVEYVRQYLMDKYGSEEVLKQGFKVYTTVNYEFQKAAEQAMVKGVREVDKRAGWRGVGKHLNSESEKEEWLAVVHRQILEDLKPPRLLPGDAAERSLKVLEIDLTPYGASASRFVGETPVKIGKYYSALVHRIDSEKNEVDLRIGLTHARLPVSGMSWVLIEDNPIQKVEQLLREGDIIEVKVEQIEKERGIALVSLEQEPEVAGAFLSYDVKNGFVRAMVGGLDFQKSKFNCALQAKRQVGSTFKPLIYAAAFDKGFSPSSLVTDSPVVFRNDEKQEVDTSTVMGEDWKPHNFGGKFEGDIPLRLALIRSMNVPTVKLLSEISIDYGIQYARSVGITSPLPRDLTIGLGSWSASLEEIMRAYAIFPRLGKPIVLNYIKRVEDGSGKILEELPALQTPNEPEKAPSIVADVLQENEPPVISPQTAYVMTDLLKAVIREGTGRAAASAPGAIAGKTGTSNDHRDAWFVGYSPHVVSGVWIGYLKEKALGMSETGGRGAAPIWAEYMKAIQGAYPKTDFPIPEDIVFAYIDKQTGRLATPTNPNRVRVAFKAGAVPNLASSNIPRVGEPNLRTTTAAPSEPKAGELAPPPAAEQPPQGVPPEDETLDFPREGYE